MPHAQARTARLNHFFTLCYGEALLICLGYLSGIAFAPMRAALFALAVLVTYPLIYMLPALVITRIVDRLTRRASRGRWASSLVLVTAALTTSATIAFLVLDLEIYRLYGYHLNGFVLNLLTTSGGIESLGMSTSTVVVASFGLVGIVGLQFLLYWIAGKLPRGGLMGVVSRPSYRVCIVGLLCLSAADKVAYGVSHVAADSTILINAQAFPLYSGITFDSFAESLGFATRRERQLSVGSEATVMAYPLHPLVVEPPERPLNIVWLVSESWRWDMLDPEIMPETWRFASRARTFTQHLSGGNGTRMGMFSMFYGLYAPYWFSILRERRGPMVIQALMDQDYQLSMHTSARFTYPEFDQTLFVDVPASQLHEVREGKGWERDRANVDDLLAFIADRDRSRPFMTFMFFESPHARYFFPEESVIREPYLADFNYATMSLERDIELIHNRYVNSCHHLDSQFGRIFDELEHESLLDDTIVILTGDHGEAFMEKGHWGHGATFEEEEIRVPLVMWIPGEAGGRVDRMTSHLDIPATLLPRLGVRNDPRDLSLGADLFGSEARKYAIVGDWSRLCFVGADVKASFPITTRGFFRNTVTSRDDAAISADGLAAANWEPDLVEVLQDLGRFRKK